MNFSRVVCSFWFFLALVASVPPLLHAQEPDPRVSPVNRPLALNGLASIPMTGHWQFSLSHGVMLKSGYLAKSTADSIFSASSNQDGSAAAYGFDSGVDYGQGQNWCASSGAMPQWIQADLGATESVSGVEITWEKQDATYQCRVEGSPDGRAWTSFVDKTAYPGIGNGRLNWTPGNARYLRITVTKANAKPYGWACLRGCKIHLVRNGQDFIWKMPDLTSAEISAENNFADPSFSDKNWKEISVPSNWEILGFSRPLYNGVDDTVGLYRRVVNVPANFAGQRIFWRFDGVFESAEVFVNGRRIGYHESGFTAFDVDLTGFVVPGQANLFAVRVCKSVPSYDMETGDFEPLGGIYRDNFLYAVPPTHISDITLRTKLDAHYVNATLEGDIEVSGPAGQTVALTGSLTDASGQAVPIGQLIKADVPIGPTGKAKLTLSVPVDHPLLWSAEKPNLYKLLLTLSGATTERVAQPFGFRQIDISPDKVLLWNGQPIKCAGTCRHEIYPTLGSALTDEIWQKDIALMKGANINAIRTSHYNHASRFMDLCDQNGFYMLDEIPFCWIQDYVSDPTLIPALLQRSLETYERDKNRPSVLAWSCGNENPVGSDEQVVLDFIHQHDPTRPAFSSCLNHHDLKGQTFTDFHYPWPSFVSQLAKNDGKQAPIVFSEQPHIFWQPTWHRYDPGVSDLWGEVISKSWEAVNSYANIIGSFIWEWQDQPVEDAFNDGGRDPATNLRYQNNKGIVTGFRELKPEYWEVKMAYSPIRIDATPLQPSGGSCSVSIQNRYSFTNLNELTCHWTALNQAEVLQQGDLRVDCAALHSTQASFPAHAGMTALQVVFSNAAGNSITGAILKVAGSPDAPAPVVKAEGEKLVLSPDTKAPKISTPDMLVEFDDTTGQLSHWRFRDQELITGPSQFNLGQEFPNDNPDLKEYLQTGGPLSLSNATWTTVQNQDGSIGATSVVTLRYGRPALNVGSLTTIYKVHPDARIGVQWSLAWTHSKNKAWEIGQILKLPPTLNTLTWLRDSVFSYYPPEHLGAPTGTCDAHDPRFHASKRGLHWLTLTNSQGTGLALLNLDTPLIGRAESRPNNTILFASREEGPPQDFSGSWVENHLINLETGKSQTGSYLLQPASVHTR